MKPVAEPLVAVTAQEMDGYRMASTDRVLTYDLFWHRIRFQPFARNMQ
jgi:hypothetical protein